MLIDDESDITETTRIYLEKRGYRVFAFNDPVTAVTNYQPGKYDLALIDIRMPRMSGFEVWRQLSSKDASLKICFFTAFEVYPDEFSVIFPKMKSVRLIKKPLSLSKLQGIVDDMLFEENKIVA